MSGRLKHFTGCFAWAIAAAGVGNAVAGPSGDVGGITALEIPEAVRNRVEQALTPPLPEPVHPIRKISIESKLPLGNAQARELVIDYLPGGLLSIAEQSSRIPADRVVSTSSADRVMLGPVDLFESSGSNISAAASTSVMAGKVYLPMLLKYNTKLTGASIAADLSGELRQMLLAAPGSTYKYRVTRDTYITSKGTFTLGFTSNTEHSLTFDVACQVGLDAPATEVFAELRGTYRKVECDVRNVKGMGSRHTFAYLSDSGFYVQLSTRSEKSGTEHRITSVEYRSP